MRTFIAAAFALFTSTAAFADGRPPAHHERPAEPTQAYAAPDHDDHDGRGREYRETEYRAPARTYYAPARAYYAPPPARPGFMWVEGYWTPYGWVDGYWREIQPAYRVVYAPAPVSMEVGIGPLQVEIGR